MQLKLRLLRWMTFYRTENELIVFFIYLKYINSTDEILHILDYQFVLGLQNGFKKRALSVYHLEQHPSRQRNLH